MTAPRAFGRRLGVDLQVDVGEGEREGSCGRLDEEASWPKKLELWRGEWGWGSYSGSWPRARGKSQGDELRLESSGPHSSP